MDRCFGSTFSERIFKQLWWPSGSSWFWVVDLKSILIAGFGSGLGFRHWRSRLCGASNWTELSAVTEAEWTHFWWFSISCSLHSCCICWSTFSSCLSAPSKRKALWSLVCSFPQWPITSYEFPILWNRPSDSIFLVGLLFAFQVGTFIEVVLFAHKNPNLNLFKRNSRDGFGSPGK